MMCYTLLSPRPVGVHPTIYLTKPLIPDQTIIDDNGEVLEDPWQPEVISHDNIENALKHIIGYNNTDDYLKNLKIITE